MQALPIEHIAGLELLTCRHDFDGLAGLGDDVADLQALVMAAMDRASAYASSGTAEQRSELNQNIDTAFAFLNMPQTASGETGNYNYNIIVQNVNAANGIMDQIDAASGTGNAAQGQAVPNQASQAFSWLDRLFSSNTGIATPPQPYSEAAQLFRSNNYSTDGAPSQAQGRAVPNQAASPQITYYTPSGALATSAQDAGGIMLAPEATQGTATAPVGVDANNSVITFYQNAIANNPQSLIQPQAGTTPVAANSSDAQKVIDMLTSGINAANNPQVINTLAQAQIHGKPLFVPQSVLNQVKAKPKTSSANDWLIATGIGLAVLSVFAVIAMGRK